MKEKDLTSAQSTLHLEAPVRVDEKDKLTLVLQRDFFFTFCGSNT